MPPIDLPEHWSARDALLVYEFLSDIQECIWRHYGVELVEACRIDRGGELPSEKQEDWPGWEEDVF